jgi:hypothetical protein
MTVKNHQVTCYEQSSRGAEPHLAAPSTSCCDDDTQAHCCEPSSKPTCCGTAVAPHRDPPAAAAASRHQGPRSARTETATTTRSAPNTRTSSSGRNPA